MEILVFNITVKIINQKKGMKTTEVNDIDRNFVVKLRGMNNEDNFLNTQLSLNECENNFDKKLNDILITRE